MAILKNTTVNGLLRTDSITCSISASISSSFINSIERQVSSSVSLTEIFVQNHAGVTELIPNSANILNNYIQLPEEPSFAQAAVLSGSLSVDSSDNFARSLVFSSDANILLIGADNDEATGSPNSSGVAYIFKNISGSWIQQTILSGSQTDGEEHFGRAVAINGAGNIAVVGAFQDELLGDPNSPGLVYIYEENGGVWQETQILQPSLPTVTSDKGFGRSVSINKQGDILAVGAFWDEPLGIGSNGEDDQGAVYIFEKISGSWQETKILSGSLTKFGDEFYGRSISLNYSGDVLAVGAAWDQTSENVSDNTGIVYIYKKINNVWQETSILTGSLQEKYFGWEVSLNAVGDVAVIGNFDAFTDSGIAYIFRETKGSWTEEAVLSGSLSTQDNDSFGFSVAINAYGDLVAIGAPLDEKNENTTQTGTVYVFKKVGNEWVEQQIITGSLAINQNDRLGYSLCMDAFGTKIASSAWNDEAPGNANSSGLVYIHEKEMAQYTAKTKIYNPYNSNIYVSLEPPNNISNTATNNPSFNLEKIITSLGPPKFTNFTVNTSCNSTTVSSGRILTATVTGDSGPFSYQWYTTYDDYINGVPIGGAINNTFSVTTTQNGTYIYVKVSGSTGYENGPLIPYGSRNIFDGISCSGNGEKIVSLINNATDPRSGEFGRGTVQLFEKTSTGYWERSLISSSDNNHRWAVSAKINYDGDLIIISKTSGVNSIYEDIGSVYLIRSGSNGWQEEALLSGSTSYNFIDIYNFAEQVKINKQGNKIFVRPFYTLALDQSFSYSYGHIFIFKSGSLGWNIETLLTSSNWNNLFLENVGYGYDSQMSISEDGDMLVITDPYADGYQASTFFGQGDPNNICDGVTFIFKSGSTGWYEDAALVGPEKSPDFPSNTVTYLGKRTAISKDKNLIFISAPRYQSVSKQYGIILIYESSSVGGWQEIYRITPPLELGKTSTGDYYNFLTLDVTHEGNIFTKISLQLDPSSTNSGGNHLFFYRKQDKTWIPERIIVQGTISDAYFGGNGYNYQLYPEAIVSTENKNILFLADMESSQEGIANQYAIYELVLKESESASPYLIDEVTYLPIAPKETKYILNYKSSKYFTI